MTAPSFADLFVPQKLRAGLRRDDPHTNVLPWFLATGGILMSVKLTALFTVLFLFAACAVRAQTAGVVSLRANSTSAQGSMAPVLTWSTNPAASSCRASGGWAGNKPVSGTQTLPTINANTNYTLTCSWGAGSAVVSWVAPTANTNGTPLTDLAGFRVYYGTSSTSLSQNRTISDVTARNTTITGLSPGTWYFAVRTLNARSIESADSNIASQTVAGASAARTVAITITPSPNPPPPTNPPPGTGLRVSNVRAYDVVQSGGRWVLGRQVGTIPLGRRCMQSSRLGTTAYYEISRSDVTFSITSRSEAVVAACAT